MSSRQGTGNYLRIRGEEGLDMAGAPRMAELPPHTRRRESYKPIPNGIYGNYLRIRGEEQGTTSQQSSALELPPHTRRRDRPNLWNLHMYGTTSAYAEKSAKAVPFTLSTWNYLRIRGEEGTGNPNAWGGMELPPHTRRRELQKTTSGVFLGTTSAYAEKSAIAVVIIFRTWNYLRIRGEEFAREALYGTRQELPPHTRRRDFSLAQRYAYIGTTSAYAEKRSIQSNTWTHPRNYLRIRGEETL